MAEFVAPEAARAATLSRRSFHPSSPEIIPAEIDPLALDRAHKPSIQNCIVMIVAVTKAMEGAPKHPLRLVEAAAPVIRRFSISAIASIITSQMVQAASRHATQLAPHAEIDADA